MDQYVVAKKVIEIMMKLRILLASIIWLMSGCSTPPPSQLSGAWLLKVENLQHHVVTTANIHFTGDATVSCLAGMAHVKKVVIDAYQTEDEQFFPVDQVLAYTLDNDQLRIGRYNICDAYVEIGGQLTAGHMEGNYFTSAWQTNHIGYFSLHQGESTL